MVAWLNATLIPWAKTLPHFLGPRKLQRCPRSLVEEGGKFSSSPPSSAQWIYSCTPPINVIHHLACYNQSVRYFCCKCVSMGGRHKHDTCKVGKKWKGFLYRVVHLVEDKLLLDHNYALVWEVRQCSGGTFNLTSANCVPRPMDHPVLLLWPSRVFWMKWTNKTFKRKRESTSDQVRTNMPPHLLLSKQLLLLFPYPLFLFSINAPAKCSFGRSSRTITMKSRWRDSRRGGCRLRCDAMSSRAWE